MIFVGAIEVEPHLLISMILSATVGSWLGADVVARLSRRAIQITMGIALLIAGGVFTAINLHALPGGGTAMSLLHVNPIRLLIYVPVINGVAAARFLIVVMRVSASKRIMGDYVNGNAAKTLGWLTAALMAAAAIAPFATGGISL